jgi:hypothetical protein
VVNEEVDFYLAGIMSSALEWWQREPEEAMAWYERHETSGTFERFDRGQAETVALFRLVGSAAAHPGSFAFREIGDPIRYVKLDEFLERTSAMLEKRADRLAFARRLASLDEVSASTVLHGLGENWARMYSFKEGAALADELGNEKAFNSLRFEVAAGGQQASRDERFAWFLGDAVAPTRHYRTYNLVEHWAEADFNGTGRFLRDLPPSEDRDRAVEVFAKVITDTEPPSAVDWALDIGDEKRRRAALKRVYRNWAEYDLPAADRYFAGKGVETEGLAGVPERR